MDHFVSEYERGRTPNPCVECNRRVKFGALLDKASELGCKGVATGHYARLDYDAPSGRWLLKTAVHPEKDQSYVLYCLTQSQLSFSRFPLGGLSKEDIRTIALEQKLVNARKGDSQDICFIPDGDYAAFIRRHTGKDYPAGDFIAPDGRVLGRHEGIIAYTLGQRRGLGVSSANGRLYVTNIDPTANTVTLSDNDALFARTVEANGLNFIPFDKLNAPLRVQAKARYRHSAQSATVEQIGEDRIRVTFDQPQRAMTPGQAVVLYDGDIVVGGGTIDKVLED
jgi:tRNA-specific 2-thiouridylase